MYSQNYIYIYKSNKYSQNHMNHYKSIFLFYDSWPRETHFRETVLAPSLDLPRHALPLRLDRRGVLDAWQGWKKVGKPMDFPGKMMVLWILDDFAMECCYLFWMCGLWVFEGFVLGISDCTCVKVRLWSTFMGELVHLRVLGCISKWGKWWFWPISMDFPRKKKHSISSWGKFTSCMRNKHIKSHKIAWVSKMCFFQWKLRKKIIYSWHILHMSDCSPADLRVTRWGHCAQKCMRLVA